MKSFDLGEHLNDIYAAFPEANRVAVAGGVLAPVAAPAMVPARAPEL